MNTVAQSHTAQMARIETKPETMPPQKVLIVRLGAMGDVIHALHAVTAIRRAAPQTTIGWLIEKRWTELLATPSASRSGERSAQRPLVDAIHIVDTFAWRHSAFSVRTWQEIAAIKKELRSAEYDAVLDMQGAIRSAVMARWAKAPVTGAEEPREKIARMLYARQIPAHGQHVIEQNFSLAKTLFPVSLENCTLTLPLDSAAEEKINSWLRQNAITSFALLNPGAGWAAKQWPVERYAEVAKQLAKEGIASLINFSPAEEAMARSVEAASDGTAKTIACSITELIALTRRARLFIGGDTGPMHLAAALRVPVVAIFGPTNPARNGPYGVKNILLRSDASITSYSHTNEADPGLLRIQAEQVVEAAHDLLKEERG